MKNKIYNYLGIFLSFLSGALFVYVLIEQPFVSKKKIEKTIENNANYNSCSNCMSGTMIVNNEGISQSINKIYDSVVMVKNFQNNKENSSGSGFVYKKDNEFGYIMTNQHVVEGAEKVTVVFTDNREIEVTVLGGDSYLDIAVLKVPVKEIISVASIGKTDDLALGQQVFTVGTPVGYEYYNSVTGGLISGLNRKVTVSIVSNSDWVQEVIQVDAAINPGNSGGPLVNVNGEVIGVNSLKLVNSSIEGMGFSIKIEDAMKHVSDLEQGIKIQRPLLGITNVNITETYYLKQSGITIDESITEGIVVLEVSSDSGAEKAGIKKGDVIIKLNDDKVTNVAYLKYLLYKYNVNDEINITYIRGKETNTVKVKLTENTGQ